MNIIQLMLLFGLTCMSASATIAHGFPSGLMLFGTGVVVWAVALAVINLNKR